MRNVAIAIAARAIEEGDRVFWADAVDLKFVGAEDRNCIGMAWRRLVNAGILKRMDLNRRSTNKASKGRIVFKYRLASEGLARTFLERNGWTGRVAVNGERLLFDAQEMRGAKELEPSGPSAERA